MKKPVVKHATVKMAVNIIEAADTESFADISVKTVAQELGVTSSYLSRLFKEEFDCTLKAYLTKARVEKAAKLLAQTGLSIKDVSDRMKYNSAAYFSRQFKEVMDLTPAQYRKSLPESKKGSAKSKKKTAKKTGAKTAGTKAPTTETAGTKPKPKSKPKSKKSTTPKTKKPVPQSEPPSQEPSKPQPGDEAPEIFEEESGGKSPVKSFINSILGLFKRK